MQTASGLGRKICPAERWREREGGRERGWGWYEGGKEIGEGKGGMEGEEGREILHRLIPQVCYQLTARVCMCE